MNEITLNTQLKLRHGTYSEAQFSDAIPKEGEPIFITSYGNTANNVLLIGDGENSVKSLMNNNNKPGINHHVFYSGKGAGYTLYPTGEGILGGVIVDTESSSGLYSTKSGIIKVQPKFLVNSSFSKGILAEPTTGSDLGYFKLDLTQYGADIKAATIEATTINAETIRGSSFETDYQTEGNFVTVRSGQTAALGDSDLSGIKIIKYDSVNDGIIGLNKDGKGYISNNNGVHHILTTSSNTTCNLIGLQNGEIASRTLPTLTIESTNESVPAGANTYNPNTNGNQTIKLQLSLNDLSDYTGQQVLSQEQVDIINAAPIQVEWDNNNNETPSIANHILYIPKLSVVTTSNSGITLDGSNISLTPVEVQTVSSQVEINAPQTIECITGLECDSYGRVTKIIKTKYILTN